MRRAIVAEGESPQSVLSDWPRGSWATATVVVALTIAFSMSRWIETRSGRRAMSPRARLPAAESVTRRQVQLIAPGGTRVIWIFNADFQP